MDHITDVQITPLTESKYIQPFKVGFKQNGKQRYWDCLRQHDSVAILLYNSTKQTIVLVNQFRPAVYMSSNRPVWENSEIFKDNSLSMKHNKPTDSKDTKEPNSSLSYGPGSEGITYECCAGIVDKPISLEEIAKEEILEETGYDISSANLQLITNFWSNIGTAGSLQSIFYCEVTDEMAVGQGGGNSLEDERIDVFHLPIDQVDNFIYDTTKKKSIGLAFALMWFSKNILPGIQANFKTV